jgi:glycogen debranching enzyme
LKPEEWIEIQCKGRCERDRRLLTRAVNTFYKNILQKKEECALPWGNSPMIMPSWAVYRGVWNWDSAFHAMAVSKWDPSLAREQLEFFFKTQREDGCFIDSCEENGAMTDQLTKPPVLFWAYVVIDKADPDDSLLSEAYAHFTRNESFWKEKRSQNGLFFYSSDALEERDVCAKWETGWDTSPRFDHGITESLWAIDLNCYMVLAYRALRYMAQRLGLTEDAEKWSAEEQALTKRINERLWSEELGAYCDTFRDGFSEGSGATGILTPASFMPLFVTIAPESYAARMENLAADPCKFYPLMPSCAYDSDQYTQEDYWRGPVWINIAYMAIKGLRNYGFAELADTYKENILNMCDSEERGLFEYYNSRTGVGLGAIDYAWTAAFIIEFILSYESEEPLI